MSPPAASRHERALGRLSRQLGRTGFALPGTILERMMRCGKAGCRCGADPPVLHGPYLQWTRKEGGKTVTRLLTPEQARRYRRWVDAGHKLHELVRELETLSVRAAEQAEGWGGTR